MILLVALYKLLAVWLALDAMLLATIWYVTSTIQPLCTDWWKANICDNAPLEYVD